MKAAMERTAGSRVIEVAAAPHAGGLDAAFAGGLDLTRRDAPPLDLAVEPLRVVTDRIVAAAVAASGWAGLAVMTWFDRPFRFGVSSNVLAAADDVLDWVGRNEQWRRHDGGFYTADVISVDRIDPRGPSAPLFTGAGRAALERAASAAFGEELRLHGPIAVHRMGPGQGVGVHCDVPRCGEETHRIVVMLARGWAPGHGGHFLLLGDPRPSSVQAIVPLVHNSAIAFRLTDRSFHAVTTVTAGWRFSLVVSFRASQPADDPEGSR